MHAQASPYYVVPHFFWYFTPPTHLLSDSPHRSPNRLTSKTHQNRSRSSDQSALTKTVHIFTCSSDTTPQPRHPADASPCMEGMSCRRMARPLFRSMDR
mmetsp:Transcript_20508/g.43588  ORF Transcript_20508/g.43588 Transcript_20508/m.43588 type:complete len:99 (-) Transcript_20508:1228-1524(-)